MRLELNCAWIEFCRESHGAMHRYCGFQASPGVPYPSVVGPRACAVSRQVAYTRVRDIDGGSNKHNEHHQERNHEKSAWHPARSIVSPRANKC